MKRFPEMALVALLSLWVTGCHAHSTATAPRPSIDSLGEMTAAPTPLAPPSMIHPSTARSWS
jgi:hypothetical protein